MGQIEDGNGNRLGPTPLRIRNSAGELIAELNENALEGGPELILHRGDIINVRNIQGGVVGSPNLDISAGGVGAPGQPDERGVVVVNGDNGRGMDIGRGRPTRAPAMKLRTYDDYKKDLATWGVPVRFANGAMVKRTDGTWRRL